MFRPVTFNPHGGRRARRRVPSWLVLLTAGVVAGAGGLAFVQHRYLPPRLSADESARLQASFAEADAQRRELEQQLQLTRQQLQTVSQERSQLAAAAQADRQAIAGLRGELASLVETLPPDPRGGAVQVRQAKFSAESGRLQYDVMLSRSRGTAGGSGTAAPLNAVMQLVVAGRPRQGTETRVRLEPLPVTLHAFESVKGSVPLPDGFDPRQASVQVLDAPGGKLLGMRVMTVK